MSALLEVAEQTNTRSLPAQGVSREKPTKRLYFDQRSDLLWGPLSKEEMVLEEAWQYVNALTINGISNWRLPTLRELCELANHPIGKEWPFSPYVPKARGYIFTGSKISPRRKEAQYSDHYWGLSLPCGSCMNVSGVVCFVLPVRSFLLAPVAR